MSFDDTSKVMEEVRLRLNILTPKKRKTDSFILILLLEQKTRSIYWTRKVALQQKVKKLRIRVMHFKNELMKSSQNTISK